MNALVSLIGTIAWLAGIVLAKGVWGVGCAIFVPFWGWYLVVEEIMRRFL